jgi:hypothetical protein
MCAGFTSCSHDLEAPSQEEINEVNAQKITNSYNQAFIATFGHPAANQDWGFSSSSNARALTRANSGENYPATHSYTDASGNVIAGANMNHNEWADPNKEFGGWVVPDPLTAGQKLRVQKYFQANPNLSYEDPHYRHFFVQQVYTGGSDAPQTGNKEATKAADGSTYNARNMNLLTVGVANSHINDFNSGSCGTSSVLDNGKTVNNGTYHSDQITLMVNVYDTSCFGYHDTAGSNVKGEINHNDKMALVSAATIDAWAEANNIGGDKVVDKWNRSFMGFDHELLPESDIVMDSYARLDAVPNLNNIPYAWDGQKIMTIAEVPAASEAEEVDITSTFAQNVANNNTECKYENGNIVCTFNNQYYNSIQFKQPGDWTPYDKLVIEFAEPSPVALKLSCEGDADIAVGATKVEVATVNWAYNGNGGPTISGGTNSTNPVTLKIKKVTLVKNGTAAGNPADYYKPTYLLGDADADKIAFYSRNTNMYGGIVRNVSEDEMKTTQDGKTCLNLPLFQGLVADGYHPVTTDLKMWVKWQAACDGYYSDWIVTLTEAQRITPPTPPTPFVADLRIMAEDLSATDASDFDFNDVVFDVKYGAAGQAQILVRAAGGTLPLRIKIKSSAQDSDQTATGNGWQEVHALWGKGTGIMINTNATTIIGKGKGYEASEDLEPITLDYAVENAAAAKDITIQVKKGDIWIGMTAETGEPAAKFAIPAPNYRNWCDERVPIQTTYEKFTDWVTGQNIKWWVGSSTAQ